MQIISCSAVYSVSQFKIFPDHISTKIKIAKSHAKVIASVGIVLDCKWWYYGFVQDFEGCHRNLNVAGRQVRIFIAPFLYFTCGLQNKFTAHWILVQQGI